MVNGPLVGEHPAGPGVHLRELMRAVVAQRPDIEVTTRHASLRYRELNRRSAERIDPRIRAVTTPVPGRWLANAQRHVKCPRERWLAGRFDVYHQLHTDTDPAVPGRRLVVTLHDTVALRWPAEEGAMAATAGALLRRAAAVITVSQFSKSAICNAFDLDGDRVSVIPNGVDAARLSRSAARPWRLPSGGRYVLYVGGGTKRKNLPRLVDAFRRLTAEQDHDDLHLVLAGPVAAHEAALRDQLGTQLQDRVHFLGYVADAEMGALYAGAAVLALPSLYEGFGLPALEAMACGLPVVVARAGALPEVVGDAGILVDPLDADDLAAGLSATLREPVTDGERRRAAAQARALTFTWSAAAQRTLAVYEEVAHG